MMNRSIVDRLAVCSWSLQPADPKQLFQQLQEIGIRRMQLALDPLREQPGVWGDFGDQARAGGFECVSGMFVTLGEDYSTLDSIRRTGGVVPDETWSGNWENIQKNAEIAASLGLKLVTFHAGFLPHEESDPSFQKLLNRIAQIADLYAKHDLRLGFETGQESAETLQMFLNQLNRPNVGVNFDPANMLLYDKGDPVEALKTLSNRLLQCHLKDATRTKQPGTWGEEVAVGTGEVDWRAFFRAADEAGFQGYFGIEREAGTQRLQDIRTARHFVESLVGASQ